jgi:hypothetical protein
MNDKKGLKIYNLKICYNDKTGQLEYIQESIDVERKALYYGTIDISDYFDEEGLALMDEMYDVGSS